MKEVQALFPGDRKTKTANFLLGRPVMPQLSDIDARNTRDRSAYHQFRRKMGQYIELHKIHFLKDALLAISLFASVNAQTNSIPFAALASVVPILGIFAHTYHWGQAEGKIREANIIHDQETEREQTIKDKIGANRPYIARPKRDKNALN